MSQPRFDEADYDLALHEIKRVRVQTGIARALAALLLLGLFPVAGQPIEQVGEVNVGFTQPTAWEVWFSANNSFDPEPQDDVLFLAEQDLGKWQEEQKIPKVKKKKKRRRRASGGGGPPGLPGVSSVRRTGPAPGPSRAKDAGRVRRR